MNPIKLKNEYYIVDDLVFIKLKHGFVTVIEKADLPLAATILTHHRAYASKGRNTYYVKVAARLPDGRKTTQYLHNILMPGVEMVDHHDGNGFNNRRIQNLRPSTNQQNTQNQRIRKNNSSGYKGVTFDKHHNKFRARIFFHRPRRETKNQASRVFSDCGGSRAGLRQSG